LLVDSTKSSRLYTTPFRRMADVPSIYCLRDEEGQMHSKPSGIAQTLTTYLRNICDTIQADDASVETLMEVVDSDLHTS